jgi:hypothetical protein
MSDKFASRATVRDELVAKLDRIVSETPSAPSAATQAFVEQMNALLADATRFAEEMRTALRLGVGVPSERVDTHITEVLERLVRLAEAAKEMRQ